MRLLLSLMAMALLVACTRDEEPPSTVAAQQSVPVAPAAPIVPPAPIAKQEGDTAAITGVAESEAQKFGLGMCDALINLHSEVINEGTMNGGSNSYDFHGKSLPAAIVKVSATCVKRVAGEKSPYVYLFVAAHDREFDMYRATGWAASVGDQPSPRQQSFDEHVAQYFRSK